VSSRLSAAGSNDLCWQGSVESEVCDSTEKLSIPLFSDLIKYLFEPSGDCAEAPGECTNRAFVALVSACQVANYSATTTQRWRAPASLLDAQESLENAHRKRVRFSVSFAYSSASELLFPGQCR
jgi:hypothetical protein